ncbi:MAG: nucleotide exchange factor GrpE [Thermoplasmata archaeon]|nr:nucleotide exchange factor GrpE [Thermoplasmata archaeon]
MADEESPPRVEPAPPAAVAPVPAEDWENRFKYLLADFENFRRRTARQQDQTRDTARADLLRGLLPIIEAFERARGAFAQLPPNDPVRRGLELLGKEWMAFLEVEGVQPLARSGMTFNADEHEAVAEAPVSPAHAAGTIVEVVQQGYSFGGGLLRPAKVVVAREKVSSRERPEAVAEPVEGPPMDPAA